MTSRVVVFIDYQNVYRRARGIFDLENLDHPAGQVNPNQVGLLLAKRIDTDCELKQVRVYRGLPSNNHQPKGYGAVRRQTSSWMKSGSPEVILRPLHYPANWPNSRKVDGEPREKGIDVELAVDFVRMAISGDFDYGIIFSMDNDLKPALEYIGTAFPNIGLAVASWWPSGEINKNSRPSTISIPNIKLKDIRLNLVDFESVRDDTDYSH
ncbi:MAG: NYN domain-containing protein [Candidatus Planktophila sp.]|nr:NYN domain-containing protein [Candidatus Planktophila sp.]